MDDGVNIPYTWNHQEDQSGTDDHVTHIAALCSISNDLNYMASNGHAPHSRCSSYPSTSRRQLR
jgi:hypothetical protein